MSSDRTRRYLMVPLLVIGAITALGIVAVMTTKAGAQMPTCPDQSGGEDGVEVQLRYVDVAPGQVTFTFGATSLSDHFGIPHFTVAGPALARRTPPPELDTGTRQLSIGFEGASGFNPDLTPSYRGSSLLVPALAGTVREAYVTHDTGRQLAWAVMVSGGSCPHVTTNSYAWGKSPRSQVTLTFGQEAWITAEHGATYVGSPILAPLMVTGRGFTPRSTIDVWIAGQKVESANTDPDGRVEVGVFVPKLQPGIYEIAVADATGRTAKSRLIVTDEL